MLDRHIPRLCHDCGAPMSRQTDDCWNCGAHWVAAPAPSAAAPTPQAPTPQAVPVARA